MDPRDQFTAKAASVARRVRAFELTDEHIWGDTEPYTYYRDPPHHRNSSAAKQIKAASAAHLTASQPERAGASEPRQEPRSATKAL